MGRAGAYRWKDFMMLSKTSLPKLFTIPTMSILLVLSIVPTVFAIIIALQNRVLGQPAMDFIWLANFIDLFSDRRFLNAVWVSVKWEFVTVTATMAVAIVLGVLMFQYA